MNPFRAIKKGFRLNYLWCPEKHTLAERNTTFHTHFWFCLTRPLQRYTADGSPVLSCYDWKPPNAVKHSSHKVWGKDMARCFLLEVNNRGVGNHLLNTINPPHVLCASLLKGLVIPDSPKKKSTALAQVREQSDGDAAGSFVCMLLQLHLYQALLPQCTSLHFD